MTTAMNAVRLRSGPKVLRVGVIRDGRIVEERTLAGEAACRIGTSEKNDFVVQGPSLPSRFALVEKRREGYVLHVPRGALGRLTTARGAVELDGEETSIPLDDKARGRLILGDTTLLFQFVSAPVAAQRPQLPAAARGGLVGSVDWMFTAFIVFSYMTFFGFVIYLENADWQLEQDLNLVPEITARLVFTEPTPPLERPVVESPVEDTPDPEEVADARPNPTPNPRVESEGPSSDPVRNEARDIQLREAAVASAEHLMLGFIGNNGAFRNVLDDGAAMENAAEVLASVRGADFASRDSATLREREGRREGSGESTDLGVLARREARGEVATGPVTERVPTGTIDMQRGTDWQGTGDMPANVVTDVIRRNLRGLQRCYERQLPNDPTLAGKVVIEFTVEERGNVTGARASENLTGSAPLAACLSGLIGRLRFNPAPVGGSVSFRYPFVFAPQN